MSLLVLATSTSGDGPTPQQLDFFEAKVRPLLVEHCYECHSVESGESNGELLVDSAAGMRTGGTHGATLVPGKPDESLLMRVVGYRDPELEMPPDQKLSDEAIEIFRRWIEIGAPDPRQGPVVKETPSPLDRDPASHWAFNVPRRARPPGTNDPSSLDPIDAFARHRASELGLRPSPIASDETLVRRLYFDLTGLPPRQSDVDRFVESDRPDAYARLVDQLLASPDFGERFGRHWLDVARYADTVGYALAGKERRYKGSERFRDWTIRAFATDMPYDQMIHHQLAGDRTDADNEKGNLDAMGFLTLGRSFLNPLDTIDDRIDVITRGLLGLTVSCTRCHDHKFDPIPMSDYYSLGGIIFSSEQPEAGPSPLMMVDKKNPIDSPILIRGQVGNRGEIAPRQFLTALRRQDEPRFTDGSGRWELAQRITAADNPLTARVMVNRIWRHLVGNPLVNTPSDFGFRTEPPAVPEVLDDLAADFAEHWSIKRIVRRIVLSRIYRQSAQTGEDSITRDPDNRSLARANRRRRDFESLRDSVLFVSGRLDRSLGGQPVEITRETPNPRRTIYAMIDRQNLPSLFRTFDFASPDTHSPGRYFTTVPQQALFLLNNQQVLELARCTAELVRRQATEMTQASDGEKFHSDSRGSGTRGVASESRGAKASNETLVGTLFERVLGRQADAEEVSMGIAFLKQPTARIEPLLDPRTLWSYAIAQINQQDRVTQFTPLGVFNEKRWQAADEFPTKPPYGHAFLSRDSGHTPSDTRMAVVRRFTIPFSGRIRLRGQVRHAQDHGDGVRASIWIGNDRRFTETVNNSLRRFGPIPALVEAGDTVDFVATAGGSDSYDSFTWQADIRLTTTDGRVIETDSTKHFSGPLNPETNEPLDRLAQLAQTLLLSNEFAFVD